jgi:hypothetical protein
VKHKTAASSVSQPAGASSAGRAREFFLVLGVWLVLAVVLGWLGRQYTTAPGLYYDEAVYAGTAKDFLSGQIHGQHMPVHMVIELFGRPFPVYVQPYLGALKSWLLIPAFSLFGATLPVLRLTNLAWSLGALLLFMIWSWKMLGLRVALTASLLLASDPTFFFLAYLDWGVVVPSFLCRFAGFLMIWEAWQRRQSRFAFLAGIFFGLGFFNKIDFTIILAGAAMAGVCALGRPWAAWVGARKKLVLPVGLGFLVGAGPMTLTLPFIISSKLSEHNAAHPGELVEKIRTLQTMYDGSYFYRLMDAGGLFNKMYQASCPVWTPLGIVFCASGLMVIVNVVRHRSRDIAWRKQVFLLLTAVYVTIGVLLLPGAVRIHHAALVVPFPHLIISMAGVVLWDRHPTQRFVRGLLLAGFTALLLWQTVAVSQTEQLIRDTHGRGWWSDALLNFSRQVKNRSDLTIVSLDWGFNEQLLFLTDGPRLEEPIWRPVGAWPDSLHCIYLLHPPEYTLFSSGPAWLQGLLREGKKVDVQPWYDHQGQIVFYAVHFLAP